MAEDAKKPYGDVEYADPGYQSDKKKRYPVDTEEHARAAWSYINQAGNASAYSSEDLAKVKAKIKAACKKFGIEIAASEDGEVNPEPIECRAAVEISVTDSNEILFLPVGVHSITPVAGGIGKPIKVMVDIHAANAVEQQRAEITQRTGKKVYFDFNHEDGPASFWPSSFYWRQRDGVVAKGEWSASGKKAVQGKDFRAFSPVFHVHDKRADPAQVVCFDGARPNMGGLVNDPAFSGLPLWAKNAGESSTSPEQPATKPTKGDTMTPEEIAALQAKKEELEAKVEELSALVSKDETNEVTKAQLGEMKAQAEAAEAELKIASLKAKTEEQAKEIERRNHEKAKAAVKKAVADGAIAARNLPLINKLTAQATVDPETFIPIIEAMQGPGRTLTGKIVGNEFGSKVTITNDDPLAIFAKMTQLLGQNTKATDIVVKKKCAKEMGALYAATFSDTEKNREQRTRLMNYDLAEVRDAIMAADVTDANLGTLAGTLVTQRILELLKLVFPPLVRFTTDFSEQPATFNQTIMTRIVTIPTVVAYSTATGWADQQAQATDVPVVINNHQGIPITFNENMLASTMRRLFEEFAEAQAYALARALVNDLYSKLTDANYTNNTIVVSTSFNRASVVDIGVALTQRGVPLGMGNRTMILWPVAFGNLVKDTTIIQPIAYQNIGIITQPTQPDASFMLPVDTFQVYTAPNLPSNNANLIGFAGSKSALCIATRTPNDYTSILPGASFGNVQMVTDPDIGLTVMQVQYVNHTLGTATNRIALMWGTAAGQTIAGQLIKAASGTGSAH